MIILFIFFKLSFNIFKFYCKVKLWFLSVNIVVKFVDSQHCQQVYHEEKWNKKKLANILYFTHLLDRNCSLVHFLVRMNEREVWKWSNVNGRWSSGFKFNGRPQFGRKQRKFEHERNKTTLKRNTNIRTIP